MTPRLFAAFIALLFPFFSSIEGVPKLRRAPAASGGVATLEGASAIFLEVPARERDSWVSLALRWTASEREWHAIEEANPGRTVVAGHFYAIPFLSLDSRRRGQALMALFPGDGPEEGVWVHRVPETDEAQSLASIAVWFGATGALGALAESNGLDTESRLHAGDEIEIPVELLLSGLDLQDLPGPTLPPPVAVVPPQPPDPPSVVTEEREGELTFISEGADRFAIYRLKTGEALYSAVVVRFTGRLDPEEVSAAALSIAAGSGITRPGAIPIGHPIRIPRAWVLPEYLPKTDPTRIAHDEALAAAERHSLTVQSRDLQGIAIILDAGHGGDDVGAQRNGVHEDDYVYDIMCRLKEAAEKTTAARVITTIRDRSSGHAPLPGPFAADDDEILLTTPPYSPRKPHVATVGVNLRWYLTNARFLSMMESGMDPQSVVFLSLHADSLHPDVRGAMVYIPGQAYRGRTYGHAGRLYAREEVEAMRYVSFSKEERERSEGLSKRLARRVIESFAKAGLPVHRDQPIRDHVIRRQRAWTPAVIRTSLVPQSLLVEIVNLNNKRDAALLKDPRFRQKAAEALLHALRRHFATGGSPPAAAVGRARRRG